MSCPICSHNELQEGTDTCPKCGSDLEIFTHIANAHKENAFQRKSVLVLITLFGTVLVSWGSVSFFSGNKIELKHALAVADTTAVVVPAEIENHALTSSSTPVEAFVNNNADVKLEAAPIKTETDVKAPEAPAPVAKTAAVIKEKEKVKAKASVSESGVIIHTVKNGDSFWTISKKYFKNGNHAKQIAKDNNLNPKKSIPLGTKLKINK